MRLPRGNTHIYYSAYALDRLTTQLPSLAAASKPTIVVTGRSEREPKKP
ncbi:MAG: hypothetical protein R2834_15700 [Rhodothermales bacterium]